MLVFSQKEASMEHHVDRQLCRVLRSGGAYRRAPRQVFSDAVILRIFFWAVAHDRPICWALRRENWRGVHPPRRFPSNAQVSRRLRSASIKRWIKRLNALLVRPERPTLVASIDGKALPVANHSRDRQARWGRGAGGKAKGYKLVAIIDQNGEIVLARVAQMNIDEREMARRMIKELTDEGYLLGDKHFDSNKLFDEALSRGVQLVAPRRYGPDRGLAHTRHSPARLRCKDLLENTVSSFGRSLHAMRSDIERRFGTMVCTGGGLNGLPAWVRGYKRVERCVQAKLIILAIRKRLKAT